MGVSVNCFCPNKKHQFRIFNAATKNYTVFADCLWGISRDCKPSFVMDFGCGEGVVASVTSQNKLDFITDEVVPKDLLTKKQVTVGIHNSDANWDWWGYNRTEFPLGEFPSFTPSVGDVYGFLKNVFGFNWKLMSGNDEPKPYLCEVKACDAENVCKYGK